MKTFIFKPWMIGQIRRISYRYPPRYETMNAAKVERGKYRCASCKEIHQRKDTAVDHIIPVIDPAVGFVDWNTYLERMFCGPEGFQVLCKTCHDNKTQDENKVRQSVKKRKVDKRKKLR